VSVANDYSSLPLKKQVRKCFNSQAIAVSVKSLTGMVTDVSVKLHSSSLP
jgi:hypothetical protein